MTFTFPELKHKKLPELKEIAAGITPAVEGYTQMNKDHLLQAICAAPSIDMHVHHEIKGIDKGALKGKIREWKKSATRRSPRATTRACGSPSTTSTTTNIRCASRWSDGRTVALERAGTRRPCTRGLEFPKRT